jgi:hypothetical protein
MEIHHLPDTQMGQVVQLLLTEAHLRRDAPMEHQVARVIMEALLLLESLEMQNLVRMGVSPASALSILI